MINVRDADIEKDALAIMDAMRDFATRITFADMVAEGDALTEAVAAVIVAENTEILVTGDDEITGCLGIGYTPFLWNHDRLIADEMFWWTASDAPYGTGYALYREALARIKQRGAVPAFRALSNSPAGVERLYLKSGLVPIETVFMGAI